MRKTSIAVIGFISVTIISFASFLPDIMSNSVNFSTDEMYWMQTARILPYILDKKFQDPYWKENMGFVNFNGAKWVYAIGLRMFNHTNFTDIGIPPFTYEKWKVYSGPFPTTHPLYSMLFHARLISAFTASLGIGAMFILGYIVFPDSIITAVTATILLRIHPIIITIATHAFADSMFLVAELAWASVLSYIIKYSHYDKRWLIILGAILGYAVSVKINASMFYILTLVLLIIVTDTFSQFMYEIFLITLSASGIFILIHPNLFFFPSYTLYRMIENRFLITQDHMNYFSRIDPPRVLYSFPQRVHSLLLHIFTRIMGIFFILGTIYSFIHIRKKHVIQRNILLLLWISMGVILGFIFLYVVFDEQRYFMPLLPFVCLIASSWLLMLAPHSRTARSDNK